MASVKKAIGAWGMPIGIKFSEDRNTGCRLMVKLEASFGINFQAINSEGLAMEEEKIGIVSNYYSKISVAAVKLTDGSVSLGDALHFLGHTTDFESKVDSMQIEHQSVTEAKKGESVGIKISETARRGDKVYKIVPD